MSRYGKILVAVDGSDSSKNAFRQACRITREDKSWLTVITVITPISLYHEELETLSAKEIISKKLKEEGERILAEIKKIADEEGVSIKTILEEGSPSDTIIDVAEKGNYDLIVIGRRGMTRLERALIGSVTARVIGSSPIDVLVVPRDTSVDFKKILVATDGSKYSETAEKKAIDLARSYGGDILAVSVVDVPPEIYTESPETIEELINLARVYVERVKKEAETSGIKAEAIVSEGEAYRVIIDVARESSAGIIVMGSHGRTGLKKVLMGSVTEKVIGLAPCPVLVVK